MRHLDAVSFKRFSLASVSPAVTYHQKDEDKKLMETDTEHSSDFAIGLSMVFCRR